MEVKREREEKWRRKVGYVIGYWERVDESMRVGHMYIPRVISHLISSFALVLYTWDYIPEFKDEKQRENLQLSEEKETFTFVHYVSGYTKNTFSGKRSCSLNDKTKLSIKCVKRTAAGYIGPIDMCQTHRGN